MKTGIFTLSTSFGLALAATSLLAAGPALARPRAQEARQKGPAQELIVVRGRGMVSRHVGSSQLETDGFGYNVLSLTRHVSYSGLNLASPADVLELKQRVGAAAEQICWRLEHTIPPVEPSTASQCLHVAVKNALKQVRDAVAASKR